MPQFAIIMFMVEWLSVPARASQDFTGEDYMVELTATHMAFSDPEMAICHKKLDSVRDWSQEIPDLCRLTVPALLLAKILQQNKYKAHRQI